MVNPATAATNTRMGEIKMVYLIDIMLGAPWLQLGTSTSKKFESIDGCSDFLFEVFRRGEPTSVNPRSQSFDFGTPESYGMQVQISQVSPGGEVGRLSEEDWLSLCGLIQAGRFPVKT